MMATLQQHGRLCSFARISTFWFGLLSRLHISVMQTFTLHVTGMFSGLNYRLSPHLLSQSILRAAGHFLFFPPLSFGQSSMTTYLRHADVVHIVSNFECYAACEKLSNASCRESL
ncbi:hypothetical protein LDENG_00169240 [Lucifuga dentata]|nr:hypothetical protein LDENG_00169240 [Lucifuga dentata]